MNQFTTNKTLHYLLHSVGLEIPSGLGNPLINHITCDSRRVTQGSFFLGLPGERVDGGIFWTKALSSGGVAALISSQAAKVNPPGPEDPVVVVPESIEKWVGQLAAAFWDRPSEKMILIGVTGTNGKTTTTFLIEHLSKATGVPTALFGTLQNRWPTHSSISTHTTAFADTLQSDLAIAVNSGARLGAMEVSSHALAQQRVSGCHFSAAVFTNLTQDHLDYHSSMDEYFEAKKRLFNPPFLDASLSNVVVNIDDSWGNQLAKELEGRCWRSSLVEGLFDSSEAELVISDLTFTARGVEGLLQSPVGEGRFISPLIGRFNLMNLLQAVGVLLQVGLPLPDLLAGIVDFPGVPGRMERVNLEIVDDLSSSFLPTVLVDYAHTPDGLKNALLASRPFASGQLICVFGCGGDRDRGKRSQMGCIAAQLADQIIITSDNPRQEDPLQIINDVLNGISTSNEITVQKDRALAIEIAITKATPDDLVLIAGKGHEDYQIIGNEKIYFDDREQARCALQRKLESH